MKAPHKTNVQQVYGKHRWHGKLVNIKLVYQLIILCTPVIMLTNLN